MRADMVNGVNRLFGVWAVCRAMCFAVCLAVAPGAVAQEGKEAFLKDVQALTRNPHRLAGFEDGSRAASLHVEQRLRDLGVKEIYVQEFPVVQSRMTECQMQVGAGEALHRIHAVRPNIFQASITAAEGLSGDTLYLGRGELEDYGNSAATGRVVVLDFDCGRNWLTAFAFGARAVLFVEKPGAPALPHHHLNMPANLPRFYVPADLAEKLELKTKSVPVKISAACTWEEKQGRSVIGVIRGSGSGEKGAVAEAVVLAAPLDSLSEVPELSPGAREAGNCAALLRVAGELARAPASRDVIVAFFDGQAQNHLGARAFYGSLYRRVNKKKFTKITLESRAKAVEDENRHIHAILKVLDQPELCAPETMAMPGYAETVRTIRSEASRAGGEVSERLAPVRIQYNNLKPKKASDSGAADPETAGEAELLKREMDRERLKGEIDRLSLQELAWNSILRVVNQNLRISDPEVMEKLYRRLIREEDKAVEARKREAYRVELMRCMDLVLAKTRRSMNSRLAELALAAGQIAQSQALDSALGQGRNSIVLHVSLNLGDASPRWGFVHGDDTSPTLYEDVEGLYSTVYKAVRQAAQEQPERIPNFDVRPVSELYPSRLFAPARMVDSGSVARMFGRYNISATTILDPMRRQGLPEDRIEALDVDAMHTQAVEAAVFLARLAGHRGFSRDIPINLGVLYTEATWENNRRNGCMIRQSDIGDPMRTAWVPDAFVAMLPGASPDKIWNEVAVEKMPPGFMPFIAARSQSDGLFEAQPCNRKQTWLGFSVMFDPPVTTEDGSKVLIPRRGLIYGSSTQGSLPLRMSDVTALDIAKIRMVTVVGYGFDRLVSTIAMRAASTAEFRTDRHLLCETRNVLTLMAPSDAKEIKFFNPYGIVLLNNTPARDAYQGVGLPLDDPFFHPVGTESTARDLRYLNQYRLNLLRENQIGEESLEVLHGRAEDIATDAAGAQVESFERRQGMMEASAAFSRRMYKPLVGVMKDLVQAVVFLLLLAIPFAFSLERLLVGTPHIYNRIGWFALFFVLTFAVLFMVNPAFKLATTPIIIFLAFSIILLSALVIFIMIRKLDAEMKKLQGRRVSAHSVDVSRMSTMAAAVNMGISTMRRRPLRTLLTSVTVVLLTFTILTFASFSTVYGNRRSYVGPMSDAPTRVVVRDPLWRQISDEMAGVLSGYLAGRAEVVPCLWLAPLSEEVNVASVDKKSLDMLLADSVGSNVVSLAAAIGMDIRDARKQPALRECFGDGTQMDLLSSNGVFLSRAVSQSLGLTSNDVGVRMLTLRGVPLLYAGTLKDEFAMRTLLDTSSLLPVDYRTSSGAAEGGTIDLTQLGQESDSASFVTFNADSVAVIAVPAARQMDARVRALTVYPRAAEEAEAIANDVAVISALPTYVGTPSGVYRLFFTSLIEASGFRDLLIPVILGGLIIFATMLGSVADREREIYTFSSLGLAPAHVAMLFFAEAAIYAVVGGMGGYLVGQVAAKLMGIISRMGFLSVPSMNFSSMNAVVTIFIVMGIVLLSTIYPAMKAARSANPGIQRAWRLPKPEGDVFDISFPFTVSEYDLTGVVSYLQEHFEGFTDASLGIFATIECHVLRQKENDMLGFAARVALAPFDLGIEQSFVILSQPSDVEGIDEVRVLIRRESGTYGDWQRANRVFIKDLRKQFLIWRTLSEEVAGQYRETTLTSWDKFSVESRAGILAQHGVKETAVAAGVKS